MNDTLAPVMPGDATALDRSPFDWFAAAAVLHAERPAVDDGVRRITYAALRQQSLALGALIAASTPPGALIALLAPNDTRLPLGMLACFAAGRAFAPIDPRHPEARNRAILGHARPAAVLAPADLAPAWLPDGLPRIGLAHDCPETPGFVPGAMPPDVVGFVTFTSGSTGQPKGVAQMPHAMAVSYTHL
ncbi:MAG: AMP-binding protein, partial [Anaerolineae bacterium]|nr:AMP-binding protein [Anaerolineae bacterium]